MSISGIIRQALGKLGIRVQKLTGVKAERTSQASRALGTMDKGNRWAPPGAEVDPRRVPPPPSAVVDPRPPATRTGFPTDAEFLRGDTLTGEDIYHREGPVLKEWFERWQHRSRLGDGNPVYAKITFGRKGSSPYHFVDIDMHWSAGSEEQLRPVGAVGYRYRFRNSKDGLLTMWLENTIFSAAHGALPQDVALIKERLNSDLLPPDLRIENPYDTGRKWYAEGLRLPR